MQNSAGVSQSEAGPVAAPDNGAAHNGSMRGERKHVRKREEPAGASQKPLIALALVLDLCCPFLTVNQSPDSLMLWLRSLCKLGPVLRLRKPCMTLQMKRISRLAVSLPSALRR